MTRRSLQAFGLLLCVAALAWGGNEISNYAISSGVAVTKTWDASAGVAPAANFPTLDTRSIHHVQDFDADSDEALYFRGVVPGQYTTTSSITLEVHWTATSATSGDVLWAYRWVRLESGGDDLDDAVAWDTPSEPNVTSTATSPAGKVIVASWSVANGDCDALTPGDPFVLEISRDADSSGTGTDGMTGDSELLRVVAVFP